MPHNRKSSIESRVLNMLTMHSVIGVDHQHQYSDIVIAKGFNIYIRIVKYSGFD